MNKKYYFSHYITKISENKNKTVLISDGNHGYGGSLLMFNSNALRLDVCNYFLYEDDCIFGVIEDENGNIISKIKVSKTIED